MFVVVHLKQHKELKESCSTCTTTRTHIETITESLLIHGADALCYQFTSPTDESADMLVSCTRPLSVSPAHVPSQCLQPDVLFE